MGIGVEARSGDHAEGPRYVEEIGSVPALSEVIASTDCPFARRARLRVAVIHGDGSKLRDALEEAVPLLTEVVEESRRGPLDGLALCLPLSSVGGSLDDLASLVRTLVDVLMALDPQRPRPFEGERLFEGHWRLNFAGMNFFLASFAPCYPVRHGRYVARELQSVILLLQPDSSFHAWVAAGSERVRALIREQFAESGRPYPAFAHDAHKFVMPRDPADAPVAWDALMPLPHRGNS
jgi:YqcI/YcgG family